MEERDPLHKKYITTGAPNEGYHLEWRLSVLLLSLIALLVVDVFIFI